VVFSFGCLKQLDEKPGVVVMVSTDALLLDGADQPASSAINVFVTGQPGLFDYYANHHSYCAIFSSVFFFFRLSLDRFVFFFWGWGALQSSCTRTSSNRIY
jgi:hypothetical protein